MFTLNRLRLAGITLTCLVIMAWAFSPTQVRSGGFKPVPQIKSAIRNFPRPGEDLERLPIVHLETTLRTAQEARTWLKLLQSPSLTFPKETPLGDVIKAVRAATKGKEKSDPGIPIYVDPIALQECDRTLTSPIVWDQEGVPLAASLRLMLKQLGLVYRVTLDGLVIVYCEGTGTDDSEHVDDASALILDNLSLLRAEIAELRREVTELRQRDKAHESDLQGKKQ